MKSHFFCEMGTDVTKEVQLYDVLFFWCVTHMIKNKKLLRCAQRGTPLVFKHGVWRTQNTQNSAVPVV